MKNSCLLPPPYLPSRVVKVFTATCYPQLICRNNVMNSFYDLDIFVEGTGVQVWPFFTWQDSWDYGLSSCIKGLRFSLSYQRPSAQKAATLVQVTPPPTPFPVRIHVTWAEKSSKNVKWHVLRSLKVAPHVSFLYFPPLNVSCCLPKESFFNFKVWRLSRRGEERRGPRKRGPRESCS